MNHRLITIAIATVVIAVAIVVAARHHCNGFA